MRKTGIFASGVLRKKCFLKVDFRTEREREERGGRRRLRLREEGTRREEEEGSGGGIVK